MDTTIGTLVRLFFLLTPFFVLSLFVSMTTELTETERRHLALRTTLAILIICLVIYLFGQPIFAYLGITLDAFRIGSGIVLMLSGIEVVRGTGLPAGPRCSGDGGDIAVVPLAIPYTVGPGTIGALLVMGAGASSTSERITEIIGIIIAVILLGGMLYFSSLFEKMLKRKGLHILSKLTGLFLTALAAQIISEGICGIVRSAHF